MSRSEFIRRIFVKFGGGARIFWPLAVLSAAGLLIFYLGSFVINIWGLADAMSKVEIAVSVNQDHCPNSGEVAVVLTNATDKQLVQAEIYAIAVSPGDESGSIRSDLRLTLHGSLAPGESHVGCRSAPEVADRILSEPLEWKIHQKSYTFHEL